MNKEKSLKVEKYEAFLNEKLKTDLKNVLDEQEAVYSEIAEYIKIKDTIEKVFLPPSTSPTNPNQDSSQVLLTKVDLGCNFYADALVSSQSKIFIAIGYGFFLEMTHSEALKFIQKKTDILNNTAEELRVKACEIKAHIRFVMEGLRELQNLEFNTGQEKKSLFL